MQSYYHKIAHQDPTAFVTLVLMPPTSSKSSKRNSSPYGTYTVPTLSSHLARRAQPQTEEPLSAHEPPNPATASSHPSPPEVLAAETSTSSLLSYNTIRRLSTLLLL